MAQFVYQIKRTHHNDQLRASHEGTEVVLMGWVQTRRDHGGVIFIDLRDRFGLTQVVFNPEISPKAHELAEKLRNEFCIGVKGTVHLRPAEMKNPKLKTGEIEVRVTEFEIFNESKTPPFPIEDGIETNELTRLEYRYLDLRRSEAGRPLLLRSQLSKLIRDY